MNEQVQAPVEIRHVCGKVLYASTTAAFRAAVEAAVKDGADLAGADLRGANLRGADLAGADLRGAYLGGAYLGGADLNWDSHALLAEILRRGAGNDLERRMVAGLLLVSPDWCWKQFLELQHPQRQWALRELAKWGTEKSPLPPLLRRAMEAMPPVADAAQIIEAPASAAGA